MAGHQIPWRMGYLGRATVYETMQGMLWLGRGLSRPIDLSHRLDVQMLDFCAVVRKQADVGISSGP